MERRELARKALGLHPYEHPERIDALLELLDMKAGPFITYRMPVGKLNIPENECSFYREEECWLNAPDSVLKCEGKCSRFTLRET